MEYTIDLPICYENFSTFKQKATHILDNLFKNARINDFMKFYKYGLITSLNKKNNQIKIEETEKFIRGKTNCMIYNLTKNKYNPGIYDKLIIYYNIVTQDTIWYAYILYNSITGEILHKYYIEYADDKLCHYIWNSLISLSKKQLVNYYSNRFDGLRNNDFNKIPVAKDYYSIKQNLEDFKTKPFFV